MKMKTYQADSMQEALSKVKEEMGPDAVILKSRKATRKVNGKNVPCFEVTAALEDISVPVRVPSRTQIASPMTGRAAPAYPAPITVDENLEDRRTPARSGLPGIPERRAPRAAEPQPDWVPQPRPMAGRVPDPAYDWRGSLKRIDENGRDANRRPAEEPPAAAAKDVGRQQEGLLELMREELRQVREKVDMPTREIQELKGEIKAMFEAAAKSNQANQANLATQAASAARTVPRPPASATAVPAHSAAGILDFTSPGALPEDLRALHAWLVERDFDADLAAELCFAARSMPLADAMAARVRATGGVRLRAGKPAVVALVGPTGAGKTTTLCKLAALAKMHQGKRVAILSADSFRMGANEQLDLFGRTAGIPVRQLFSAADAAPALKEFATCDLILVDTAGRSHAHPEAWSGLQNLLKALGPDEIHLVLSCTTRMRELLHQAGLYGNLGRLAAACGVVFTKLDECVTLGSLYNLARRLDAPVSYLCDGQVIPDHISLATPQSLASKVLHAGRAAEEAWKSAQQPMAIAG